MMITVMLIMLTMMMIMIASDDSLDDGNNINNDRPTQIYFGSILLQA